MRSIHALPAALALIALAACSSRDDADEAAASPTPALTTQAAPTVAADGTALTPGKWEVGEDAAGASATYAEAGMSPVAVFACNRNAGDLTLAIVGSEAGIYRLEAGSMKVGLDMAPTGGMVKASVDLTQPIFAALADPATVLAIAGPGNTALRLPGNAGISRVIASCS